MRKYAIASVEYILSTPLSINKMRSKHHITTYYCNIASLSTRFVFFSMAVLIHSVKEGGWRELIKLLSWNFTEHRSQEKIHFWCGLNKMWHIPLEINLSGDGLQILLMDQSLYRGGGGSRESENFGCVATNFTWLSMMLCTIVMTPPPPPPSPVDLQSIYYSAPLNSVGDVWFPPPFPPFPTPIVLRPPTGDK